MFWDFLNVHKYIWSMKKKKKPRGYDHQPADPPPPGWAAVKDSMFFGRGGGRGSRKKGEEKNLETSHSLYRKDLETRPVAANKRSSFMKCKTGRGTLREEERAAGIEGKY